MAGDNFDEFYKDLKETEKKDSTLTPKQQIDRLLRPGSTYRNLNPYEVLQIDPELPLDEVKKKYRRLSILVHPDKNPDDRERAQAAFDALRKANSLLEDDKTRRKCYEIVEEARGRTGMNMEEKRKKKRKEAIAKGIPPTGNNIKIEEDDPIAYKHAVAILTMKLFADLERKRREAENKISTEAAKTREAQLQAEEKKNVEKEFVKNWEDSRQGRVNSWLNFTGKPVHNSKEKNMKNSTNSTASSNQIASSNQEIYNSSSKQTNAGNIQSTYGTPQGSTQYSGIHSYGQSFQQSTSNVSHVEKKPKKKKEKRFSPMGFRPPKHKPETRD